MLFVTENLIFFKIAFFYLKSVEFYLLDCTKTYEIYNFLLKYAIKLINSINLSHFLHKYVNK